MHYTKLSASRLLELMEQHIVILDGAMGTMIQQQNLTEENFRGKGFLEKTPKYLPESPLQGNNDLLSITRPDVIENFHLEFLKVVQIFLRQILSMPTGFPRQTTACKTKYRKLIKPRHKLPEKLRTFIVN